MNISRSEPLWLELEEVLETHAEQLLLHGGTDGIRDLGLIESAIGRAYNLFAYDGEDDILVLAVRLGLGLAQNHGFVDGNKRTGVVSLLTFLATNGYFLDLPNDTTLGVLFEAAVSGDITEEQLVDDLFPHVQALPYS